jgi:hypothetical protein
MSSIASVLLKITGDSDDARQAVIATARDVAALDGQQANVGIDVDSAEAQIKIGRLTGQLDELGRKHVNPEVSVRAEEMIAELAGIEAVLLHLDGQSVHVDVDGHQALRRRRRRRRWRRRWQCRRDHRARR